MFAGPNGSGKSTLKSHLPPALIGICLNADELEQEIRQQSFLDFTPHGVTTTADAVLTFLQHSKFLNHAGFGGWTKQLTFSDGWKPSGIQTGHSFLTTPDTRRTESMPGWLKSPKTGS